MQSPTNLMPRKADRLSADSIRTLRSVRRAKLFRAIFSLSLALPACPALTGCSSKKADEARARQLADQAREALVAKDDRDLALKLLDQSIAAQPLPEAYSLRASVHLLRKEHRAAMDDVNSGLALDPDNERLLKQKSAINRRRSASASSRASSGGSTSFPTGRPTLGDVYKAHRHTQDLIEKHRKERERRRKESIVKPVQRPVRASPAQRPVRARPARRR